MDILLFFKAFRRKLFGLNFI